MPRDAEPLLDDHPFLGIVLDEKYALVGVVGAGGYGTVYRGFQLPLHRPVAVKILLGAAFSQRLGRERFEREAQALSRLSSVHTVRLLDFGVTRHGGAGLRNLPYMVMELLEGESLEARQKRAPLRPDEVADVVEAIAESLIEAHAQGIIHRDLKPSNVILTRDFQGRTVPKVIDFGIARVSGGVRSETGFVTGTPAYMSPEQVQGVAELDTRVDVYALGVMCFELIAGKLPFMAAESMAILNMHVARPMPQLTWRGAPAPPALDATVRMAMAKSRDERYSDPMSLATALRASLDAAMLLDEAPTVDTDAPPGESLRDAAPSATTTATTPLSVSDLALDRPRLTDRLRSPGFIVAAGLAVVGAALGWRLFSPRREVPIEVSSSPQPMTPVVVSAGRLVPTAPAVPPTAVATAATAAPTAAPAPATAGVGASPRPIPHRAPDKPASPGADTLALASQLDERLAKCSCVAAADALHRLEARPDGASLLAAARKNVAACRPVDPDRKCVDGHLVEVE